MSYEEIRKSNSGHMVQLEADLRYEGRRTVCGL